MVLGGFGGQNNPVNDNATIGDWDGWPNNIQNIPNFNVNDDVECNTLGVKYALGIGIA